MLVRGHKSTFNLSIWLNFKFRKAVLSLTRYFGVLGISNNDIENALSEKNKYRLISELKSMKPNSTLIARCTSEAAVLVPLCVVHNKPSLLFTLRSDTLFKHRGEVSFPGGMRDKEDKDLIETAVRETIEELGIKPDEIEIWAPLTPMPDRLQRVAITPVLGYLGAVEIEKIPFNHQEVSKVFSLPIKHALEHRRFTNFKTGSRMPVFTGGPHKVWGLTAIIMDRLFEIMFSGQYKMLTLPKRKS